MPDDTGLAVCMNESELGVALPLVWRNRMPMLPSGRAVGIDSVPAREVERTLCAGGIHYAVRNGVLEEFRVPRTLKDLLPWMRVIYFVPKRLAGPAAVGLKDVQLDPRSHPISDREVLMPSGYTLAELREATAEWSAEDVQAFVAFLREPRTLSYLGDWFLRLNRACNPRHS
jgi:hypothetical protein